MEAGTIKKTTASSALKHPVAIEILVIANEQRLSPSQFVEEFMEPRPVELEEVKRALSHVSYHFRALAAAGCLEIVERIPRRGSFEHIYVGTARAYFSDEEWARLPQLERYRISTTMLQGLVARAESDARAHLRCAGRPLARVDRRQVGRAGLGGNDDYSRSQFRRTRTYPQGGRSAACRDRRQGDTGDLRDARIRIPGHREKGVVKA